MSEGIKFLEGFEGDEDSLVWETMPLVRDADHARSGDFGVGWDTLGLPRAESPLFAETVGLIIGFAFRWRAPVFGGSIPILELRGPGDFSHVQLQIDAQSLLVAYSRNDSGEMVARAYSTPRRLDEGAWYYVEMAVVGDDSAGSIVVQLNGPPGVPGESTATVIDVGGIRTFDTGLSAPQKFYNQFHCGVLAGFLNESRNFSFDDFYVRELSEGFLGDQAVIGRSLESDRSVDFTPSTGIVNKNMVDEIAPDDDTTYNEADEDGAEDVFEVSDSDFAGTIHAVQLVARAKKTQTQVWKLQTLLDLEGVKTYGGDDGNEWYLPFPNYETLPPDVYGEAPGGLPWTLARFNAIGAGYRVQSPDLGS